jgi:hypothetical protein
MLTDEEKELLSSILAGAYGDLREEIYKTENTDYKAQLKKREALFASLAQKLEIKL